MNLWREKSGCKWGRTPSPSLFSFLMTDSCAKWRTKMKHGYRLLVPGLLLGLILAVLFGATNTPFTGQVLTFGPISLEYLDASGVVDDLLASRTDEALSGAFDAPAKLQLLSVQVTCLEITGGDGAVFEILEAAAVNGATADMGASNDGDPQFMTITDAVIDDEDQISFQFTSEASEVANNCSALITAVVVR